MDYDVELLEITKDNMAEAQFMASNFIDRELKNRIFINVSGAEAVANHLEKFGMDLSDRNNIHSIKRIIEKIDIADIILNNIHIDVRVIWDDNLIFIPKSHVKYGIVPDIYVVLKYDRNVERTNLIGFFEPSIINYNNANEDYYFVELYKLRSPFEMIDFIHNFNKPTEKKLSQEQIFRGRELSVKVADHDVTDDEFKEFLSLLLKSNELRGAVLEYDNFETLASKVAYGLQIKQPKKIDDGSIVDVDDFMNIDNNDLSDNDDIYINNSENETGLEDINGDELLDDNVTSSSLTPIAGQVAAAATGAVISGAALSSIDSDNVSETNKDISSADDENDDEVPDDTESVEDETTEFIEEPITETVSEPEDLIDDSQASNSIDENEDISNFDISDDDISFDNLEFDSDLDLSQDINTDNVDADQENLNLDSEPEEVIQSDIPFVDTISKEEQSDEIVISESPQEQIEKTDSNDESSELNKNITAFNEELDFSDFEDNISEQASEDFMDDYSESLDIDDSEVSKNDINEEISQIQVEDNVSDDSVTEFDVNEKQNSNNENIVSFDELEQNMSNNFEDYSKDIISSESNQNTYDFEQLSSANIGYTDIKDNVMDKDEGLNDIPDISEVMPDEQIQDEAEKDQEADSEQLDFSEMDEFDQEGQSDNTEVSFEVVDDLGSFETIVPEEENIDIDFQPIDELVPDNGNSNNTNGVKENSVIISDKNYNPGEICIDINMDNSRTDLYAENEHLEQLYDSSSSINSDNVLNNDVRIVSGQSKPIPLAVGLGGIAFVVLVVGIIIFSVSKFMNPANKDAQIPPSPSDIVPNNLGTDVPHTPNAPAFNNNGQVVMDNNVSMPNPPRTNVVNTVQTAPAPSTVGSVARSIPSTSFISVKKLSWEVPDYVSYDSAFKQYFQSSGKSLKSALSSDLLLATDYAYSDLIKVSISFDRSGMFQGARILLSSGSSQVDNIVLQSVNQTLKVLKAPSSLGNDESTTVILKIYL